MELKWMGKYRDFFEYLYYYINTYEQVYTIQGFHETSVECSIAQIQILEYILENEERNQKMVQVARRLGVSAATFSKNVKKMTEKGLLEKYQKENNKKDIIVKVSPLGRKVYEEYVEGLMDMRFRETFQILDTIPDRYVEKIARIFKLNADSLERQRLQMKEKKKRREQKRPVPKEKLIKIG